MSVFESGMVAPVCKAIEAADMGFVPEVHGEMLTLTLTPTPTPTLTLTLTLTLTPTLTLTRSRARCSR